MKATPISTNKSGLENLISVDIIMAKYSAEWN